MGKYDQVQPVAAAVILAADSIEAAGIDSSHALRNLETFVNAVSVCGARFRETQMLSLSPCLTAAAVANGGFSSQNSEIARRAGWCLEQCDSAEDSRIEFQMLRASNLVYRSRRISSPRLI